MKNITILLIFIFSINLWSAAPYGIKGQSQSGTLYSNVHQFPNNQVTNLGGINALVETGNKNILVNPSFEHSTFSTGWTNSAGTFTEETVLEIDGLKSAKLVLSSQTMSLTQSSTLYQAQFADGVQGLASVRVKSNVALKVCAIQAGVVSSSLCVDVQANNKWGLYKVPFILGATSNGISIASTGAVSGTVYIDDAFVGAVDLQATVDQSRVAGQAYFAGIAGCTWTRASTTIGAFGATAACLGPTIAYSSLGSWQTTDSDLPRVTINNLPAGVYKAKFIADTFNLVANGATVFAINDGTTMCFANSGNSANTTSASTIHECTFTYSSSGNRVFELYAAAATGTAAASNTRVNPNAGTQFILEYYGSGSIYSSTNADTDWATCNFSTLAWQGLGTVTNNLQCKRQGSDLVMRGRFTVGTPTASEARIPLPLWNGSQLLTTAAIATTEIAGFAHRNVLTTTQYGILSEASVAYLTMDAQSGGTAGLTKQNGSTLFGTSDIVSFTARIPIAGWQNSNIIIGQFNGLESCTDTYQCTDVFSAKVSAAGVVSEENIDWINGNASITSTAIYTITTKSGLFSVTPNCLASPNVDSRIVNYDISSSTSSSLVFRVLNSSSGALTASPFNIICQKQGADYIGKTAKAVASDQNIATPGTVKSTMCSAKISSTGVISDQKGGCFASCTNATTPVCTFTSNYWVSGQVPNCWYVGANGSGGIMSSGSATSTTYQGPILNGSFVPQVADRTYFCHGERQ